MYARLYKKSNLKVSDLPPIRIWKKDFCKIWMQERRRLAPFKLGGLD